VNAPDEAIRYRAYGVTVESEIELTLPLETCRDVSVGDVVHLEIGAEGDFRIADAALRYIDPDSSFRIATRDDGAVYMGWNDWLECIVSRDGKHVICRHADGLPFGAVEAYLTNFALAAALLQQGEEPLHATVVDVGGRLVALAGPSGAGKSTLAAFLIARGAALFTDDMLRITFTGASAIAHPGPKRLKLFREAAETLLPDAPRVGRFHPAGEKLIFDLEGPVRLVAEPRPLSALFFLDFAEAGLPSAQVDVERLAGLALFQAICSFTINSRLSFPARLERQFRFAERLAGMVPVYRLTYPREFHLLDEVACRIEAAV
jgi:hypothetical protein